MKTRCSPRKSRLRRRDYIAIEHVGRHVVAYRGQWIELKRFRLSRLDFKEYFRGIEGLESIAAQVGVDAIHVLDTAEQAGSTHCGRGGRHTLRAVLLVQKE